MYLLCDECESFSSSSASLSSSELAKYAWCGLLDPRDLELNEDGREMHGWDGAFHGEGVVLERRRDSDRILLSTVVVLSLLLEVMDEGSDGAVVAVEVDIEVVTRCSDSEPEELPKLPSDGLLNATEASAVVTAKLGIFSKAVFASKPATLLTIESVASLVPMVSCSCGCDGSGGLTPVIEITTAGGGCIITAMVDAAVVVDDSS
mmetsp:Transcript_576/g.1248  ORF Transcript_576/g.1248 Transcript_576/m.1248 type:complete len:205 (-) Transcript_576:171-785(-)